VLLPDLSYCQKNLAPGCPAVGDFTFVPGSVPRQRAADSGIHIVGSHAWAMSTGSSGKETAGFGLVAPMGDAYSRCDCSV
jgi:hypothetical protein